MVLIVVVPVEEDVVHVIRRVPANNDSNDEIWW